MSDKIVAGIFAHQDDELRVFGTLAKYKRMGWDVHIVIATNGNAGSLTIPPKELAGIRRAEGEASAAVIGAHYHCLDIDDGFVMDDRVCREKFVSAMREIRPVVVLTHDRQYEYHPDHNHTGQLAQEMVYMASVPHVFRNVSAKALDFTPMVAYNHMDERGPPNIYVDVSDFIKVKAEAASKHVSQIEWLRDHGDTDDLVGMVVRWSKEAAERYAPEFQPPKCDYAELFRVMGWQGGGFAEKSTGYFPIESSSLYRSDPVKQFD